MPLTEAAPARPSASDRQALIPLVALVGIALVAWGASARQMSAMDHGAADGLGGFAPFVVVWASMMAAMMFPSVAPAVAIYVRLRSGRPHATRLARAVDGSAFVSGYLLTWVGTGAIAYLTAVTLYSLLADQLSSSIGGNRLTAGVLVMAAAYELSPAKDVCLVRCRGPLGFFLESWRGGALGALRMGLGHGAWCVGCCWALMASLWTLGVMNLTWMLAISAVIAAEKLLPWRPTTPIAAALAGLALAALLTPTWVSAPGSHTSHEDMGGRSDIKHMPTDEAAGEHGRPHHR